MSPTAPGDLDVAVLSMPAPLLAIRCGLGAIDRARKPPASRHRHASPGSA